MLWKDIERRLNKSGRKWAYSPDFMSYRSAILFCEDCEAQLGIFDMIRENTLRRNKYCSNCAKRYARKTPYNLSDTVAVIKDVGNGVWIMNRGTEEYRICYFGSKGRYIKIRNKRIYLNCDTIF